MRINPMTNEVVKGRKRKLFEEFGIRAEPVGERADRKVWRAHWRQEIQQRQTKLDLGEHAVLVAKRLVSEARVACEQTIMVAKRRVSEAKVERDNLKITLSVAVIEFNKYR
jgi:hypothetical protein